MMKTKAVASLAPFDMPSTKGPAMGFAKKTCKRYPDTESAPPRIRAASTLGILMV